VTTPSYQDTGLIDGITYYYRVRAYDEVPNLGPASDEKSGVPQDSVAPGKVTGVSVVVIPEGNTLNITWIASSASDLQGYAVYRSLTPGFTPSSSNNIVNVTTNHYLDTGLTDDITYYYKIRAYDEVPNMGPASDEASGIPHDSVGPEKITGFTIDIIPSGNALNLTWNPSTAPDIVGYRIYRSTSSGFIPDASNNIANVTTNYYTDTGLTDGVTYYYRIKAYDEVPNLGTASDEKSGIPSDTEAPPKITNLIVDNPGTGNTLQLSWVASSAPDLAHYIVYRNGTAVAYPTTNSYTDVGLIDGATYVYYITAVDEVPNEGEPSDNQSNIPTDEVPPEKVVNLQITVDPEGEKLSLTWNASSAPDVQGYRIYRSTTSGFVPDALTNIANVTTNYYTDTGLTDGITYYYRVRAYDEVPNLGTASDEKSGTPQDTVAPSKVIGVSIAVISTGNQLNITWTASTASDLAGYAIYRSTTSGFIPSPSNNIANVTVNYYLDTGLTDDITYYYRIKAFDEVPNMGTASDQASGTPHDSVPPEAVTGLSITNLRIGNTLKLTWNPSSASDIDHYNIYRSISSGFVPSPSNLIASTNLTEYNDTGLTDGITYYYRVIALDEVPNEGNPSSEKAGIPTDETPPDKITNLLVINPHTGNRLKLSWDPSSAPDLDSYRVYRETYSGFTPNSSNLIATVSNNYYYDTSVVDGITYYYRVTAIDEVPNEGTPSNEAYNQSDDTTPPEKVVNVIVTNPGVGNLLDLTWDASTAPDVVGYRIYRSQISGFTPSQEYYLTNVSTNHYTDTGLNDDETYFYRIIAYDEVPNFGTPSSEASGTPHDSTPPDQITNLKVDDLGIGNALNLTWDPSNAEDLVNYKVYRSTTPGFTPGPSYLIAVPNEGPYSNEVSNQSSNIVPPQKVTGLQLVSYSDTWLFWNWTQNPENDILNYSIYRSEISGFTPNSSNWLVNITYPQNWYNDTNVIFGHTYYYRIIAVDIVGNEGEPSDEEGGTPGGTAPGKVENVTVINVPSGNAINLEWADLNLTEPAHDIQHYNVYRSTTSGFSPSPSNLIGSTQSLYYNDTGLTDGITYYYRVIAVDTSALLGTPSDEVNGTPSDSVPPAQVQGVIVNAVPEGNALNITWQQSTDGDVVWYYIYNSTDNVVFTLLANVSYPTNYYVHTGLIDGNSYYYKVAALDEVPNIGQNSTTASGIPQDTVAPPQVTGLTISIIPTGNTIYLTWDPSPASDVVDYVIYWGNTTSNDLSQPPIYTTNNYYTHTHLTDDIVYYYQVAARDEVPNEVGSLSLILVMEINWIFNGMLTQKMILLNTLFIVAQFQDSLQDQEMN